MQQEPVHKDNKELRGIIREKLQRELSSSVAIPIHKDIIKTIEDYYLPAFVYFFLDSEDKDFTKYISNINLFSGTYINITRRVLNFLNIVEKDNLLNAEKILGDIHPFSSTKVLRNNRIEYKKYPDYYEIINNLAREIFDDYQNFFPKVTREEGGEIYREFIKVNKKAKTEEEINQYYYNLGRFIPFLLLIRAIDINAENILINLPYPVFFDLESIFSGKFEHDIEKYSLRNTGIIKTSEKNDSSAITGGIDVSDSYLKPIICTEEGRPHIKWKVPSNGSYDNIPIFKDEQINPRQYSKYIESGYLDSTDVILQKKIALFSTLDEKIETFTRIILRPTRIYRIMILKSFYPQIYLNVNLDKFFKEELSKNSFLYRINPSLIVEKESESIRNLLVPVFYSNIFNKDILYPNGEKVGELYETQYNVWTNYIKNELNSNFFKKQYKLLQDSLL